MSVAERETQLRGLGSSNTMKLIYLDQNKWIALARAYYGQRDSDALRPVVAAALASAADGTAAFPLSAIHYMETWRTRNVDARARLGAWMWELSRGQTLACWESIIRHELEAALARRFPEVTPSPFSCLGAGAAHAFGMPPEDTHLRGVEPDVVERCILAGETEDGVKEPPFRTDIHRLRFRKHLEELPSTLAQLPPDRRKDALYALSLAEIVELLDEVLGRYGLRSAFRRWKAADLTALVNDLPSRRIDLHLHQQFLRNPALRPRESDLDDWGGLGPAAAYCDVLVCEKHFADLIQRDGFVPRATILTDLAQLGALLDRPC